MSALFYARSQSSTEQVHADLERRNRFLIGELERLDRSGQMPVAGVLFGLSAFVMIHVQSWNVAHIVGVVLPLWIVLTALYLWRRETWLVVIVHGMVDLPLVVLAFLESLQK